MKVTLVNFANAFFAAHQQINSLSGKRMGCSRVCSFGPDDIDEQFATDHAAILQAPKGSGFWLWKPYFIKQVLCDLAENEFLIYTDSGMAFVNPLEPLIDFMRRRDLDLLVFGEGFKESAYTKRDAFVLMDADQSACHDTAQRFANAMIFRVNDWSREFVSDYLAYCSDERIITEQENQCGLPNYPGFVAHRHDQSVFSLLSKKRGVPFVSTDAIAAGFPGRGKQILNHYRASLAPGAVFARLVAQGVFRPDDFSQPV